MLNNIILIVIPLNVLFFFFSLDVNFNKFTIKILFLLIFFIIANV